MGLTARQQYAISMAPRNSPSCPIVAVRGIQLRTQAADLQIDHTGLWHSSFLL